VASTATRRVTERCLRVASRSGHAAPAAAAG
jgi:hypothetical protein